MSDAVTVIVPLFSGVGALALVALAKWIRRVIRAVDRLETQVEVTNKQVTNNGGASMKDTVDRLEAALRKNTEATLRIERKQNKVSKNVAALEARLTIQEKK